MYAAVQHLRTLLYSVAAAQRIELIQQGLVPLMESSFRHLEHAVNYRAQLQTQFPDNTEEAASHQWILDQERNLSRIVCEVMVPYARLWYRKLGE